MNQKVVFPEQVRVLKETKTLYHADGKSNYFLNEAAARQDGATHERCATEDCDNPGQRHWPGGTYCKECSEKKHKEEHLKKLAAAPIWDGSFPVCIGEAFLFNETALIDHLIKKAVRIDHIDDFHSCEPEYAHEAITKEYLNDQILDAMGFEDAEVPADVEVMIDEFIEKLKTRTEPISWTGTQLCRLSPEQISDLKQKVNNILFTK